MSATSMLGVAIGVAAGAAAALLLAPMRGSDLRTRVRTQAREAGATLQSYATSARAWADRRMGARQSAAAPFPAAPASAPQDRGERLTATFGEIVNAHGEGAPAWETQS
jgi:gas vesicle protein